MNFSIKRSSGILMYEMQIVKIGKKSKKYNNEDNE